MEKWKSIGVADGFQVLGGDSEDVVEFLEMISFIKEATIGRPVVVFML